MSSQPWAHLLTRADVAELHARSVELYGGDVSPAEKAGCVDGAIGNAWTAECYSSDLPHVREGLWFAAHLLFYLVRDHCFIDGNKRAGWLACVEVLRVLGLTLEATDDDAERLCEDIIGKRIDSGAAVVGWMGPRLRAV